MDMFWISILLAGCMLATIVGGFINRQKLNKGIGWQFIRFNVSAMALPLIGLLAVNNLLTGEIITLISVLVGYAFGKSGDDK